MLVNLSNGAKKVITTLKLNGFSAYAVGGAVRDALLGKKPYDFDITTDATPQEVKALFDKVIETGIAHGTVTVMIDKEPLEVTTFRADGEYIDNRKPKSVTLVKDVRGDLARRDFTINALCYNDEEGILDLFSGIDDLNNKIIRAIGEPEERFREDALRILRAVRFSVQLGFEIEKNTLSAIKKCAELVKNLSVERITAELDKILMSPEPDRALLLMYEMGILDFIMPEMADCYRCEQNIKWHIYDVGNHTAKVVKNCNDVIHLRYAALMHDWGKVHTRGKNDEGEDTFRNHAKVSEALADEFTKKYKFSNERKDKVLRLVKYHDIEILPEKKYVKRAINKVGDDIFSDLIMLKRADCLSQNLDFTASRLPYIEKLEKLYEEIKENKETFSLKNLAIDGNDLIELGVRGKKIGEILNALLEVVMDDAAQNEREILIKIAKDLV